MNKKKKKIYILNKRKKQLENSRNNLKIKNQKKSYENKVLRQKVKDVNASRSIWKDKFIKEEKEKSEIKNKLKKEEEKNKFLKEQIEQIKKKMKN